MSIVATDATASEPGSDTGQFAVSRTSSTTAALTVNYSVGGAATNGADYTALSGTVTIPAGSSSAAITVAPIDDSLVEGNETVVITLSSGSGYTVGTPTNATVTIADNDVTTGGRTFYVSPAAAIATAVRSASRGAPSTARFPS